ncbi:MULTISPECIES: ribose-5-phosphate isomerase RpiA [Clostridia]|uniref:ribose-5-phosphate isomerase RpiA n=1 Tax=Clostridia TaxID=186801 RepID=UPI0023F346C8|nr:MULTISPECIES: ribose-5-phosphate isomerase RpiA [Clostridia]MDD4692016.1 ribose-5-phosphate isomerase RpiA [Eubacterium aggregans]MEA5004698.1 ribose-5-phosphate isomerase RpiA [Christensenella sp.]
MKRACAQAALKHLTDGMVVGFGGGSTVGLLIEEVAAAGLRIQAASPSGDTLALCRAAGIPILPLEMVGHLDVAFDGCDELDARLNAIKSCGGIHTREKIAAALAKEYILLADESKVDEVLRFDYPIPLEVLPAAAGLVQARLSAMGLRTAWRRSDTKAGQTITDDGHYLLDVYYDEAPNPAECQAALSAIPGVVETGLFYQMASAAIIAGVDGICTLVR